jgi:phage baseplate assembly protein W
MIDKTLYPDYLLLTDAGGVMLHDEQSAPLNELAEWLATPRGSEWGRPAWGHTLSMYRHQPADEQLAVSLENQLIMGVLHDLPHIQITAITATPISIDQYQITAHTSFGIFKGAI